MEPSVRRIERSIINMEPSIRKEEHSIFNMECSDGNTKHSEMNFSAGGVPPCRASHSSHLEGFQFHYEMVMVRRYRRHVTILLEGCHGSALRHGATYHRQGLAMMHGEVH